MNSTRKKRQSNTRLFCQLDDFYHDIIMKNAANDRQQNVVVKQGTVDQEFTVTNTDSNLRTNENPVNVQTLERCFNERIDRKMSIIVDTIEDRI